LALAWRSALARRSALACLAALSWLAAQAAPGRAAPGQAAQGQAARGRAASAPASSASAWSAPTTLSPCAGVGAPRAAFPRDSPTHATGPGAVVWSASRACRGGAGTLVARVGPGDVPERPTYARAPDGGRLTLLPPLALAPAPHGQLVIAGSAPTGGGGGGALVQGGAGGPFTPLGAIAGSASMNALATGYLGDLASATPSGGASGRAGVRVQIERYFARSLSPASVIAPRAGAVQALTVGLDYRTDAVVAWRQAGALYAQSLPARGGARPTQRLASAGSATSVAALISDDDRAIVAWADDRAGHTSIYLDVSASGVRFGAPRLLESFADPAAAPYPSSSPRLVRLSSESVMMAWSGAARGHWVVRSAAIDLNGIGPLATISDPHADALLSDLEPGPDGEALALWAQPRHRPAGGLETTDQALYAARGLDAYPDTTKFGAPEAVAAPGPNADATLAFDPASDRALALWRGEGGAVEYAIRAGSR
jgi:hypothetical protein